MRRDFGAGLALRITALFVLLASAMIPAVSPVPVQAATASTKVTFKVESGQEGYVGWSRLTAFFTPVEGATGYALVYQDGTRKEFKVADPKVLEKGVVVLERRFEYLPPGLVIESSPYCSVRYGVAPNTGLGQLPPPPPEPPYTGGAGDSFSRVYEQQYNDYYSEYYKAFMPGLKSQWEATVKAWPEYQACLNKRAEWEAGAAAREAEAKTEGKRLLAEVMGAAAAEMAKIDHAEALGLPPAIHLGGAIEVPANPEFPLRQSYEVVLEGCIKATEGGTVEKEDYEKSIGFQFDEAFRNVGGALYTAKTTTGNTTYYLVTGYPDSQGGFRFFLGPGARPGQFQVVFRHELVTNIGGKALPTPTPSAGQILTVKVVDPKSLKKRLTRYVDPACGGGAEYEDIATPALTASSPQTRLDYPYGYLDYKVDYANPSQTTSMKDVSLAIAANSQTIFSRQLGEVAPGARGSLNLRVEMQEKGIRLLVNGKEEALPGLPSGSLLANLASQLLPEKVTLQARLTASGVEEAASEPLTLDVVDWKKRVSEWENKQVAALTQYKEWQAKTQELDPEGAKLLAEVLEPMRVLLQYSKSAVDLIDQVYGKDRLKKLAEAGDAWKKDANAALDTFMFAQRPLIREKWAEAQPVFTKYGFRDEMSQAEAERLFASLPPKAQDELREAYRPIQELAVELVERFKKENPELMTRGHQRSKEAQDFALKMDQPVVQLQASQKAKAEEAIEKLNALSPRLKKYADSSTFKRELERRLAESFKPLGPEAKALATELAKAQTVHPEVYQQTANLLRATADFDEQFVTMAEPLPGAKRNAELVELVLGPKATSAVARANAVYAVANAAGGKSAGDVAKAALATEPVLIKGLKKAWEENQKAMQILSTWHTAVRAMHDMQRGAIISLSGGSGGAGAGGGSLSLDKSSLRSKVPGLDGDAETLAEEFSNTSDLSLALQTRGSMLRQISQTYSMASHGMHDMALGLIVNMRSPAILLVSDSQGRKTGYDPVAGKSIQDIPGSAYTGPDSTPQFVFIPFPTGEYKVDVTGTGTGQYHVGIARSSSEGTVERLYAGSITPSQTQTYTAVVEAERPLTVRAPGERMPSRPASTWTILAVAVGALVVLTSAGLLVWRRRAGRTQEG